MSFQLVSGEWVVGDQDGESVTAWEVVLLAQDRGNGLRPGKVPEKPPGESNSGGGGGRTCWQVRCEGLSPLLTQLLNSSDRGLPWL